MLERYCESLSANRQLSIRMNKILKYAIKTNSSELPIELSLSLETHDLGLVESDMANVYKYKTRIKDSIKNDNNFRANYYYTALIDLLSPLLFTKIIPRHLEAEHFKTKYLAIIKNISLDHSRYLKRLLDKIRAEDDYTLENVLKILKQILKDDRYTEPNRKVLTSLSKFIKNLPDNAIKISLDLSNYGGLYKIIEKLNKSNVAEAKTISTMLYRDIRQSLKAHLFQLNANSFNINNTNLLTSFSVTDDYQYKIDCIRKFDPNLDWINGFAIIKLRTTVGIVELPIKDISGAIIDHDLVKQIYVNNAQTIPDISQYFLGDNIFYINFRRFYLEENDLSLGQLNMFDHILSSTQTSSARSARSALKKVDCIMGSIINAAKTVKYMGIKLDGSLPDFIETIKVKLNSEDHNVKLVLLLYNNTICNPYIYAMLCDLINVVSQDKITVLYDYTALIVDGQAQSNNIKIACPNLRLLCKEGDTYYNNEYTKGLLKIYDIIEGLGIQDDSVTNFLFYIKSVTTFSPNYKMSTAIFKGRRLFNDNIDNLDDIKPPTLVTIDRDKFLATLIDYNIIRKIYKKKKYNLSMIDDNDADGYSIIMFRLIRDIINLYNKMIQTPEVAKKITLLYGSKISTVKIGMPRNPIINLIIDYIKDIFVNFKSAILKKEEAAALALSIKERTEKEAAINRERNEAAARSKALQDEAKAQELAKINAEKKQKEAEAAQKEAKAAQKKAEEAKIIEAAELIRKIEAARKTAEATRLASIEAARLASIEASRLATIEASRLATIEASRKATEDARIAEAARKAAEIAAKKVKIKLQKNKMSLSPIIKALFSRSRL